MPDASKRITSLKRKDYICKYFIISVIINGTEFRKHFIRHTCRIINIFCGYDGYEKKSNYKRDFSYPELFYGVGFLSASKGTVYRYYSGACVYGGNNGFISVRYNAVKS